jgi:hypothetical protein
MTDLTNAKSAAGLLHEVTHWEGEFNVFLYFCVSVCVRDEILTASLPLPLPFLVFLFDFELCLPFFHRHLKVDNCLTEMNGGEVENKVAGAAAADTMATPPGSEPTSPTSA